MVVTIAVSDPEIEGRAESRTVNDVAEAAVTAPTTPLLNTTVLFPGVLLKPVPVIVTEPEFAFRLVVVLVTDTGTVAT